MTSHEEPKANVTDAIAEEAPRERPVQVVLALTLAIAGLIVGALTVSLNWKHYSPVAGGTRGVVIQAFTLLFMAWVYYKIYVGSNWARIVYLALSLSGFLFQVSATTNTPLFETPPLVMVSIAINSAGTIAILWLLFTRPGSAWFSRRGHVPAA
jgi:hypothetical protein